MATLALSNFGDLMKNPPALAAEVFGFWKQYNDLRQKQLQDWSDVRKYVFATDTTHTTAQTSPWRNKTTRNKLCRLYDMLITQYSRHLMPNEDFFRWYADKSAGVPDQIASAITHYMRQKVRSKFVRFKQFVAECLMDFVLNGNTAANLTYVRKFKADMVTHENKLVFQGAIPNRIMPQEIVFDPLSVSYESTSVCQRVLTNRANFVSNLINLPYYDDIPEETIASIVTTQFGNSELQEWIKQEHMSEDGVAYMNQVAAGNIEILSFYGNIYDAGREEYWADTHIVIADRVHVLYVGPYDNQLGIKDIVFTSYRKRPDNLWGQGPLENLLGLQYRIDHLENLKADSTDMMSMPVVIIRGDGIQEDFEWIPGKQWNLPTSAEVDIEYPDPKILLMNEDIMMYERAMEEYASLPRETAGFRTAGEKTAFEVDQLLNNANQPFEEKLAAFEAEFLEPLLNLMLESNLMNATSEEFLRIFPENTLEVNAALLENIKSAVADGSIYSLGSKHYKAEQKKVQEITSMLDIGAKVQSPHINSFAAMKAIEREIGAESEGIVDFGAAVKEQAMLQQLQNDIAMQMQQGAQTGATQGQ